MSVTAQLETLRKTVDEVVKEIHALHNQDTEEGLPKDETDVIIDTMQYVEDKLANLLAEYGVEIGDERID